MAVTDGSGDGYGDGDGDGYGSGSGDGYGSGYGYGDGYGELLGEMFASHPLLAGQKDNITIGFWRSDSCGLPCNGGRNTITPAQPGVLHEAAGPLRLCSSGLHAATGAADWDGERIWVVALLGETVGGGNKMAALRRLILEEVA